MMLRGLLLKIETGQPLSEKQEKKLASRLYLIPSFSRALMNLFFGVLILILVLMAYTNTIKEVEPAILYLASFVVFLVYLYVTIFPKRKNIMKYLQAVEKFYETKFEGLDHFDLYYIGQHKSPHIRSLRSSKIYLLSDGFHILFIDDYFKDTAYQLPSYLSNGQTIYMRVIDKDKNDQSRILLDVSMIENFRLSNDNYPVDKKVKIKKYETYFKNFLDQNQYMTDRHYVTLKLNNGTVFRLSYKSYDCLKKSLPLREVV